MIIRITGSAAISLDLEREDRAARGQFRSR